MAEMERMTAEEVVRQLLEDPEGADLVRDSLRWAGAAADGRRGLGADRPRPRRALRRPRHLAQRLPPQEVGHPRRRARAAHPQAAPGQLLPLLPRAPPALGAGAAGGDPASLRVRGLNSARRPARGVARAAGLALGGEPDLRPA